MSHMIASPAGDLPTNPNSRGIGSGRRMRGRVVRAAVIVIIALFIATIYAILSTPGELMAGAQELQLAETQLKSTRHQTALQILDRAQAATSRAHDDFAAANVRLTPLAPILDHLGWLPRFGPRLAAAAPVARTATLTTAGILPLLSGIHPIAAEITEQSQHNGLQPATLLRQLAAGRPEFRQSCTLFVQALEARSQVPAHNDPAVSGPLRTFDKVLPRLRALCGGLQVLPGILGYPKPRTYLVAYQDPFELRAEGGFIGSAGLLTLHDGTMRQQFGSTGFMGSPGLSFGADDDLNIAPPQPDRAYNNDPVWLFRDSSWSPNFPTSAQIEAYIFKADSHKTVDGVINLVPQAAADLLRATGPLYIPEYHRVVSASNVAALSYYYTQVVPLHLRQLGRNAYGPYTYANPDTQRKQFIGIVAQHIFERLGHLNAGTLQRLVPALHTAFRQKDLLLYVRDPAAESFIHVLGAGGRINPTSADYLYMVDDNLSFNKVNRWIHVRWQYHVHIRRDRWLDVRLTIHYHNAPAPATRGNMEWMGPCGGACGSWGDYATFLRIYTPNGAQLVDQTGWTQPWTPGPAYGKTEFDGYLIVRRGRSATVTLHYVVPPNVFSWSRGSRYRLTVQRQPGSHPDEGTVQVSWGRGQRYQHILVAPRQDWSTTLRIPRLPFHAIPLPADPQPTVAPNHWIEPHTYLTAP